MLCTLCDFLGSACLRVLSASSFHVLLSPAFWICALHKDGIRDQAPECRPQGASCPPEDRRCSASCANYSSGCCHACRSRVTVSSQSPYHAHRGLTCRSVRVSTGPPNQTTVEGTIYVADPITNMLVLNVSPAQSNTISASSLHAPNGSYRFIPISQISVFQLQSLPQTAAPEPTPSSNTLDTNALQNRLNKTIAQLQTAQSRQGPKGTTAQDQGLFDSLSRTMPMRWQGTSMVISDTYIIDKPYLPNSVRLIEGSKGDLDRMRRVLDMEKNKLALKMGKNLIDTRLGTDSGATRAGLKKGG